jgi:hypothetical protein
VIWVLIIVFFALLALAVPVGHVLVIASGAACGRAACCR